MIKLMKYELRRNLSTILVLYALIIGLEGYALISMFFENQTNTAIAFSLLMFGAFAGILLVFIMAIQSYSRELGSKYSYMIFMTPNSTYKIIGSKLLSTGIVALITTIVAILLIVLDYNLFINTFDQVRNSKEMITDVLTSMGYNVGSVMFGLFVFFLGLWISIFSSICLAYFSITLSATIFANRKFRGIISFVIFVIINIILAKIGGMLPDVNIGSGTFNQILEPLLSYLLNILIMIAAFWGSAILLDKHVSL